MTSPRSSCFGSRRSARGGVIERVGRAGLAAVTSEAPAGKVALDGAVLQIPLRPLWSRAVR